jgi:hypothetical protein
MLTVLFREIADQFEDMIKALEKEPKKYAYRTSTAWIGRGNDRTSAQDIMHVFYFDNLDGLHRFAHAPSHRVGWDYWNKNYAKFDHIAISHGECHRHSILLKITPPFSIRCLRNIRYKGFRGCRGHLCQLSSGWLLGSECQTGKWQLCCSPGRCFRGTVPYFKGTSKQGRPWQEQRSIQRARV